MNVTALGAALWQQDMINSGNAHLLEAFVVIAGIALAAQAVAIIAVAVVVFRARREVMGHIGEIKAKVYPMVEKSQGLIATSQGVIVDLTPQIKEITAQVNKIAGQVSVIAGQAQVIVGHAEEISTTVKDKVNEISPVVSSSVVAAKETFEQANGTVRMANQKTQDQVARVNAMVSAVLDSTTKLGKTIEHGVTLPVREVSGIVNGLKAGVMTFLNSPSKPKRRAYQAPVGTYEPPTTASMNE